MMQIINLLRMIVAGIIFGVWLTMPGIFSTAGAATPDTNTIFPGWDLESEGIIGDDNTSLFDFIPKLIDILFIFVAPALIIILAVAGLFMIFNKEEDVTIAKNIIKYSLLGLVLIVISYTLTKIVYWLGTSPI